MKCKTCGNDRFLAKQRVYISVIVDENGNFIENLPNICIEDADAPYGPYVCCKCGKEFETLND